MVLSARLGLCIESESDARAVVSLLLSTVSSKSSCSDLVARLLTLESSPSLAAPGPSELLRANKIFAVFLLLAELACESLPLAWLGASPCELKLLFWLLSLLLSKLSAFEAEFPPDEAVCCSCKRFLWLGMLTGWVGGALSATGVLLVALLDLEPLLVRRCLRDW